ncbi:hypothetical protein LK09_10075 [Microbacterium mangrovi]|uniref:Htaa domain-containing protein n=1 Tax=Microbacterium mangrovi TaxID=1348253 RepID=A0A0B2A882_9MICO|nr:HtaA domain-containing protein [Microbacterium mangrovi]KHK97821.1 hypothetical protein LK09_10075 [Microbacterium mangrovi]
MSTSGTEAGALQWAIRDSLLSYVTRIARGTSEVSGGAQEGEGGTFRFPLTRAVQEGADWRLSFAGSVRLRAHHGHLDILIQDPEVAIGPEGGVLATHVAGAPDALLPLVALSPAEPLGADGRLQWSDVEAALAGNAVEMFGSVYAAGTEMAPIGIEFALDS